MSGIMRFPVTFCHDNEPVFETEGYIYEVRGEPHDTAHIYETALKEVVKQVKAGTISEAIYTICNITAIERPEGIVTTYTDEEIRKIGDEAEALDKYRCTRDSQISIYIMGGITGGLLNTPINVQLERLSEADFVRTSEIVDLLQSRRAKKEYAKWGGDFGYYVDIGPRDADSTTLKQIFRGGPFSKTPLIVQELDRILTPYAFKLSDPRADFSASSSPEHT